MKRYVAACSFGKDSMATVILALKHKEPLDEVVYCEVMFDEETSGIIVAAIEDEIVGFAVVQYIERPESAYNKERKYFHIEEFGVDEKHRRKGIATAMINFIKEDAKNRGFKRIELDMWEFNDGALAFYESAGLKTYRRYMETHTRTHTQSW